MLTFAQLFLGAYGLLLIAGGIMGKVKTVSAVSLIAGGISGLAALYAGWLSLADPEQGFLIGLLISLLLTGIFLSRFMRTKKFMPAGMVLIFSILVAALMAFMRSQIPTP